MKKFINEHPKLYWMIVGVLAVIVFSIVTAVGCAKLERAEAAEDMTFGGLYTDVIKSCRDVNKPLYAYLGIKAFDRGTYLEGGDCVILLQGDEKTVFAEKRGSDQWWATDYMHTLSYGVQDITGSSNASYNGVRSYEVYYLDGNVDFSAYEVYDWINFVDVRVIPVTYSYLVNAPYAVIDDYVDYNEHLNTNFTKLENDEFTVEFSLGGQPMKPEHGYLLDYTLYVWLPSKLYINNHYGDFTEQYFASQCGRDKNEFTADMKTWRYGVGTSGDSVLYKLPLKYEFYNNPETETSGKYRIQLDYKDIIDYLESAYGDGENEFSFEEYYDNENLTGYLWDFVLSHMVVSRMDALVYTRIDDVDTYYGRTTTFTFLRNGNFVYSEVNKDALNEDISSDMSDGINNALQEGLIQSGDKVDELQQNINNVSGSLGSFDTEFEGVDLWNGIKGFGSGLIGLTGFLGNIATALGSVFVFMPYDVRQLVGYFFMASLVVALWKLIKR